MTISDDPVYLEVFEALEGFRKRFIERIEKRQQKLKACKINNVIQSKMAQEQKLNEELKAKLVQLSKKGEDIDRVCANFASGVTISDRDQSRLDSAKEMYEIGKKLTGIRFDFSAPPDMVKGYIKCERRRFLSPFSLPSSEATEALWGRLREATACPARGPDENEPPTNN